MSKPKKKRCKKYQPGRATIPTWVYDLWGPLTEENYQTFEAAVRTDLSLIRMGTWDGSRYGDLLFALRQLYAFAKSFDGSGEYELLATMATGALHALKNLADEEHKGLPKRPKVIRAALAPLEQALETYFTMMRELHRSEHEAARRKADRTNLTKALEDVAAGGVCIVAPDETDGEVCRLGCSGVAYVNSACEVGHLARDENRNLFWVIDERGTFVRLVEPTLMFFVEDKPSKDPKWTTSD